MWRASGMGMKAGMWNRERTLVIHTSVAFVDDYVDLPSLAACKL